MQVKLGDLGLAVKLMSRGDKRNTLCGTPNYIAPEILVKKGHSFEVDIWSMGCIMYTMLVGKPPFETNSLKETYSKIKKCEYIIPEDKVAVLTRILLFQKFIYLDWSICWSADHNNASSRSKQKAACQTYSRA